MWRAGTPGGGSCRVTGRQGGGLCMHGWARPHGPAPDARASHPHPSLGRRCAILGCHLQAPWPPPPSPVRAPAACSLDTSVLPSLWMVYPGAPSEDAPGEGGGGPYGASTVREGAILAHRPSIKLSHLGASSARPWASQSKPPCVRLLQDPKKGPRKQAGAVGADEGQGGAGEGKKLRWAACFSWNVVLAFCTLAQP